MSIKKAKSNTTDVQDFFLQSSGWKIKGTIERHHQYKVETNLPDFKRLSADRPGSSIARTAMADYCRLLADVNFWTAVATKKSGTVDAVARRIVPALPIWSFETWQIVAKLEPNNQYGLAEWLSENCFRVPYAQRSDPKQDLETLIIAWLDFDPGANWFQPEIAESHALKAFVEAASGFITAKDYADKKYSFNKRTRRHGQQRKITRTTRLIEGVQIYNNLPQQSVSKLHEQLKIRFGKITVKGVLQDISVTEARDAIMLFNAKESVCKN
jgi:hypothetical protein